jgi:ATP-binding cassette, subfamily C, bacterial CydC
MAVTAPAPPSSTRSAIHWSPRLAPHGRFVSAGLLGAAATASGFALTATSGWLIVRASMRPEILTLLVAIVGVRAFGLARPVLRYAERLRSHDAALSDLAEQRTQVYAALVPLTPACLGRQPRAEVLGGVVDDLTEVVESQARVSTPAIAAAGASLAAVALATLLFPPAGLVLAGLVAVAALVCLVGWVLESGGQQDFLRARADVLKVSDLVARQADELRAIGAGAVALDWLEDAQARWMAESRRQSEGRALLAASVLVATGLATAATALVAARGLSEGAVSSPVAALLVLLPMAVGEGLGTLPEVVRALARARASSTRLERLLDQSPAVVDRSPDHARPKPGLGDETAGEGLGFDTAYRPRLRLHGVAASWPTQDRPEGATFAPDLAPVDLDLPPGRQLAVVGPNGSGKSTLVAMLARHLDPIAGRYTVDGVEVRDLPLAQVRELFAIVDDEPHIFATSLRENMRLAGGPRDDSSLVEALCRAGLGSWLEGLPDGLDTRLGTGGRGVSGGERARIGLARALVSGRPVLLLDEPVAHLDHATATAVLADLASAMDGATSGAAPVLAGHARTVVMVTHRPDGLEHFDTVLDLTPRTARIDGR